LAFTSQQTEVAVPEIKRWGGSVEAKSNKLTLVDEKQ